ncbi:hypothetical protein SSS_10344 [Sarcoptes scabiei]|nr:hypothetical protein SSS_10344 [Sarcoptes scabiei]
MSARCDLNGIICCLFFYGLISYADYVFIVFIVPSSRISLALYIIIVGCYQLCLLMIVWSHLMCVFSDAGRIGPNRRQRINQSEWRVQNHPNRCNYIQQEQCDIFNKESESEFNFFIYNGPSIFQSNSRLLNNGPSYQQNHTPFYESDWSFCKLCRIYRPPGAHHCDICRHCILQMDHHCPWINNCVGQLNQKYFLQFTSYSFIGCLYTIVMIFLSLIIHPPSLPLRIVHTGLFLLASFIFASNNLS